MFIVLHMAAGYNVLDSCHIKFLIPGIPHSLSTFHFHFLIQLRDKEIENLFSSQGKRTRNYKGKKGLYKSTEKYPFEILGIMPM